MAIDHPLPPMSVDDKLQAMKLPWADLSRKPEQLVSPAWHGEVLRSRREVGTPPSACGGGTGLRPRRRNQALRSRAAMTLSSWSSSVEVSKPG